LIISGTAFETISYIFNTKDFLQIRLKQILSIAAVLMWFQTMAQSRFRTVVPQQPVVVGESFRVQYIIEDAESFSDFIVPIFKGFHLVAGPDKYTGSTTKNDHVKKLSNIVFTLTALHPGKFIVPGASVILNGKKITSNDVFVEVISEQRAAKLARRNSQMDAPSEYFLHPGEDPYEKISRNLFLKVNVNRQSCYVGEPVVATFKLYSRLESKSEIIKNPGFYGFGVHDIISLSDKINTTEYINGRPFDVHVIRKVQLYPLQHGDFIIDAMELENKVEFSNSAVNKRTEQEIVENMYGNIGDEDFHTNATVYETSLKTVPVNVHVKPLPANTNKKYTGAVGNFSITSSVDTNTINKNGEGYFTITIRGKGNFTQVGVPEILWPRGLEYFEPVITDQLDKQKVPLQGNKSFRFAFACSQPGNYLIAPVSFTFFNSEKKRYEKITTDSIKITVLNSRKKINTISPVAPGKIKNSNPLFVIAGVSLLALILLITFLVKDKSRRSLNEQKIVVDNSAPSVESFLLSAQAKLDADDKIFYRYLEGAIWNYFSNRLGITGSQLNKENLAVTLIQKDLSEKIIKDLLELVQQCETAVYTDVLPQAGKNYMLSKAENLLQKSESVLIG
jgi:hypothetical protein